MSEMNPEIKQGKEKKRKKSRKKEKRNKIYESGVVFCPGKFSFPYDCIFVIVTFRNKDE